LLPKSVVDTVTYVMAVAKVPKDRRSIHLNRR